MGVGHLGRHHARVVSTLQGVAAVGVHDHHEGRAEAVSREFSLPILPTLEAVSEVADAVVVATPTSTHASLAGFFLERGLDVLVEKPIAVSLAEADGLVERARAGKRILQVGHVERYNPAIGAVLSRVVEARFLEVHRLGIFTPRSLDVDVVLDLMIHDLQLVQAIVGRADEEIRAAGVAVLTPRIDIANARIAFAGGCVANLTASRVSAERVRKCRVFAPDLYLSVDMQAQSVSAYRLSREGKTPEIVPLEIAVERAEPLERELADFVRCVRDRAEPLVSGRTGRDALALAQRVLASIEAHRGSVAGVPA